MGRGVLSASKTPQATRGLSEMPGEQLGNAMASYRPPQNILRRDDSFENKTSFSSSHDDSCGFG